MVSLLELAAKVQKFIDPKGDIERFINSPKSTTEVLSNWLQQRVPKLAPMGERGFINVPQNKFWQTAANIQKPIEDIAGGLRNFGIEAVKYPASVLTKGIFDPTIDVGRVAGATLAGQTAPQYQDLKSPVGRLGYQYSNALTPQQTQGLNVKTGNKEVIANFAGIADPIVKAAFLNSVKGAAGKVNLQTTKQALFQIAKQSAVQQGKWGALQGLISGVQSAKDINDLKEYATKVGTQTGTTAALFGAIGFATPYISYGTQAIGKKLRETNVEDLPIGLQAKPKGGLEAIAKAEAQKPLSQAEIDKLLGKEFMNWQDVDDPVAKITKALQEAKPIRSSQEALYRTERSRRAGAIAGIGERVPGEKGYFEQLGQLKGEMPKVEFEGIRNLIGQDDIDALFNKVEGSALSPFEKITAKTGLAKLLGANGGTVPTEGELGLLNTIFPPEFTQAVLDKRSLTQKLFDVGKEALNLPRGVMATGDLSAPLRQGIFLVGRPKQWIPAFKDMMKSFLSEDSYQGIQKDIASRPTYPVMREYGLALTDMDTPSLTGREEVFMSNLAEKIPMFGKLARASNRAYTGFLNKLRADVFDDLLSSAQKTGATSFDDEVFSNPKVVKDIAGFVNAATGRGDLPSWLQKYSGALSNALFSPRLMASRLTLLSPSYYVRLEPFVRKEALKSLLTFAGTIGTVASLAKLAGASVGEDPRSADFMKIKVGNTRYDFMGGFQQYLVAAYRLMSGQMVSSTTGREFALGEGYKPTTRKDIILRFIESKESPIFSFITSLLEGKTATGEDVRLAPEIIDRFIPMVWQDAYDLAREEGSPLSALKALPALFGTGVQTYGDQVPMLAKTDTGKPKLNWRQPPGLGESLWNSITNQQVSDVPEEFREPLAQERLNEQIRQADVDRAKKIVLQTGEPMQVGDTFVYLENGIVKTKSKKRPSIIDQYLKTGKIGKISDSTSGGSSIDVNAAEIGESINVTFNKELFKYSDKQSDYIDGLYYIKNESNDGTVRVDVIDLTKPIDRPEFTGNTTIDKQLKSDYSSKVNARIKDVIKLWQVGQLSQDEAIAIISQLEMAKLSTGGGTKAKKLDLPKISAQSAKKLNISPLKLMASSTSPGAAKKIKAPSIPVASIVQGGQATHTLPIKIAQSARNTLTGGTMRLV